MISMMIAMMMGIMMMMKGVMMSMIMMGMIMMIGCVGIPIGARAPVRIQEIEWRRCVGRVW